MPKTLGSNPILAAFHASFGWEPPDIIEFIVSDKYLNRPNLYPRQATLLKTVFLQTELFTQYDYDVLGEWSEAYTESMNETGEGNNGIVPDILQRVAICRDENRPWFRECVITNGRRGGKGHMGAIAGAYVLWTYMGRGDPHFHYGVDRDKRLAAQVFAGKKEQAKANQWGDLRNVILGGNCFSPYISKSLGESLTVMAPNDINRMSDRIMRGIYQGEDMATFEIVPKESTVMAARGPASFMQFYDEMAHVVKATASADAGQVYESATPSLDQFGKDAFIWEPSSPWQKLGKFYENYLKSLQKNEDGTPTYPEVLMVQLASWDIYKDWQFTNDPALGLKARSEYVFFENDVPEIKPQIDFLPLKGAIQEYDESMRRLEMSNPETFAVERRSHFASAMDAYLKEERIADIWKPWPNESRPMQMQSKGKLAYTYRAHGDPSKSGANFGFAIAHMEGPDERDLHHVVFDVIHAWRPSDYPENNNEIDYDAVEKDLMGYMDDFMPEEMTFDQFNSVGTIQRLNRHVREKNYPKRVTSYERTATGPLNWNTYEAFKTAIGLGLIHAPFHDLANLELTFLQDLGRKVEHPTSGPVQTKDVADCMAIVTYKLIGPQMVAFVGKALGELHLGGAQSGGMPLANQQDSEVGNAFANFSKGRRQGAGGFRPAAMGRPRRF